MAGQFVLIAAIALAPADWAWAAPLRIVSRGAGGLLILAGVGVAGWAMRELGPNLTPLPQPRSNGSLIRTGLYRWARHPIYAGLIAAAFGWALWKGSGLHVLLSAALALYVGAKASYEERHLLVRFPEYRAYRRTTRWRFFPGFF